MLVYVHINVLDINLTDAPNQFVDMKDSRKQTFGIFLRIIHNICEIKLTLRYFPYIYIGLCFLSNVWNLELRKLNIY